MQPQGVQRPLGLLSGGARMRGVPGPRLSHWERCLTHTRACTHTGTHTCMHTHACTQAHTCAHRQAHTCALTDTRRFHCRYQVQPPPRRYLPGGSPPRAVGSWGIRAAQPHPRPPIPVAPRAACFMGAWRSGIHICKHRLWKACPVSL